MASKQHSYVTLKQHSYVIKAISNPTSGDVLATLLLYHAKQKVFFLQLMKLSTIRRKTHCFQQEKHHLAL